MIRLKELIVICLLPVLDLIPMPRYTIQLITLKHDKDYDCLIVVNDLRHDRDTGSVFMDAFS